MRYPSIPVRSRERRHLRTISRALAALLLLILATGSAHAQLSGTYNVGGAGDPYTTLQAAITSLASVGVSGPVTFRIEGGTYTPPTGGYVLPTVAGMSATNTVTIKPKAGARVIFDGTLASPIFNFDGGDYFILDGTNGTGSSRDMKIVNRNTANPVIQLINGAQFNAVRNVVAIGAATGTTTGIVKISTTTGVANSYNRISSNTIGDSSGAIRSSVAIYMKGTSTAQNSNNVIERNDVVNFGSTTTGYGIYYDDENLRVRIDGNQLRVPVKGSWTGACYGIYVNNADADADTIVGNRIIDIQSGSATGAVYSIYISSGQSGRTVLLVNNMVTLNTDGGTVYGLYLLASGVIVDAYYNSVYLGGANAGTSISYGVYKGTSTVVTLKNNIIANVRTGTTANANRTLYVAGTTGALTSDYNAFYNTGTASNPMGYVGSTYYATLAAWKAATSYDANSVQGDPQFVDELNGDLHISTTDPTPVESKGTPIPGWATDFDGNTRHATRPDIGADEGTFTLLRNNDLQANAILSPAEGSVRQAGVAFTPQATVANGGVNTQSGVAVRMIIRDASGTVVYEDVKTTGSLSSGAQQIIAFSQIGSVSGSTSLPAGTYTVEFRTELAGDDDTSNDLLNATFQTKAPLAGSYTIDPAGSGSRNFPTFTAAVAELNSVGVSAAVTFLIAGGSYSVGETFPLHIGAILGGGSLNTVTFRPAAGATVALSGTGTPGLFELDSADYVTFDGSNSVGGTTRDWTVTSTGSADPAFRLENGAQYNTIRNMIVKGSSTSTTDGIISVGTSNVAGAGNSYNRIIDNTLGDVSGSVRSSVGIYASGTSTAYNTGNVFERNDIVNFTTGTSTGYGIYISGSNQLTRVAYNRVGIPVKSGAGTSSVYGIYWSNSASLNDTIVGNRIYDLQPGDSIDTYRGIYIGTSHVDYTPAILDNMIEMHTTGASTNAGIYVGDPEDSIYIYHNTIVMTGSNGGTDDSYGIYVGTMVADEIMYIRNNIIINERTGTTTTGDNQAIHRASAVGTLVSTNNVLYVPTHASSAIGYVTSARTTLGDWQSAGYDANSVLQRPVFVDERAGDLHLHADHLRLPFKGEGIAMPGLSPLDIDRQTRSTTMPDIGADEGNYNGGGLALQYPNGGEQFPVDYDLTVRFTANRALPTYIEYSADNGATWTRMATIAAAQLGANTAVINLPDVETLTGRVRIISQINAYEGDTSNASFSLHRPFFVVRTPNGGERYVPTDTVAVRWTSQFMAAGMRLDIQHSTNNGATWTTIASGLPSRNLPDTNVFNWVVPNATGTNNLVRVYIPDSRSSDVSNATFVIEAIPSVTLTSLNAGTRLFAGETAPIVWSAVNTRNVRLEYSIDNGATWSNALAGGRLSVGSSFGSYPWIVPTVNAANALVRVVNDERTRFSDTSNLAFEIVTGELTVKAPNGGESYELNQPISVTYDAPHSTTLRLEYSADGGATWQLVAPAISAAAGSYTFTPTGIPTRRALVRLTDESRLALRDVSDAPFEIMEARSIVVFTPSLGEQIMRSTVYPITWQAIRVNRVNIDYSATGGSAGSWVRVATDISAAQGTFNWTAPSQNTAMGIIRISEVGGPIVGESGQFSVITPVTSLRVLRPNGGESYTAGDEVLIGWTSANIATVSLEYSSDGGASWLAIPGAANLPAVQSTLRWTAPNAPGTGYRVKVNGGNLNDMSDGNFTILRKIVPSVTVLYPNGGERLAVDSAVTVNWLATDITGPLTVSYSVDNGGNWTEIGQAPAGAGQINWTVPASVSEQALVRVVGIDAADVSDAPFAIEAKIERTLTLSSPNTSSVVWKEGDDVTVTWSAQNVGSDVSVSLSSDNGVTWTTTLAASTPAAAGTLSWRVPHLSDVEMATMRVKVASLDGVYQAISSESFTFRPLVAGVETGSSIAAGLRLDGAYPNPFQTATSVRWTQSVSSTIELRVYDQSGTLVRRELLGQLEQGAHAARIDAALLPAGVYHYELRSAGSSVHGTLTLVR
jgi:hypothetical protein